MNNLKELSFEEMVEVDGGGFWAAVAVGVTVAAVIEIISDWDNFKAGLRGEEEIKCNCN